MRRIMFAAALAACSLTAGTLAAAPAPGNQIYIGEIRTFGFNFCPQGWSATNGALLPIQQNPALFSLLGTKYGGDGRTTFALPNISMKTNPPATALTVCIATTGFFPPH